MIKPFRNILGSIINNHSPFGRFLKKMGLGTDLASAMENVLKYYTHAGLTDEKKEDMALQDEYLDENREQEYALKEQWYNAHESLPAKKAEMEEAGLNPMLLAGQGSVSASNAPSGQAPSASGAAGDPVAAISSLIGVFSQAKDWAAAADLKKSEKLRVDIDNEYARREHELELENKRWQLQVVQANLRKLNADAQYSEWAALYAPDMFQSKIDEQNSNAALAMARYDEAYSEVSLNEARVREIQELCKNHQKERQEMDAKISLMREQIQLTIEQSNLTHEQIEQAKQTAKKFEEEIKLLGKQIGLADKDLQYYIMNHVRVLSTDTTDSGFGVNATIVNPENGSIERRHGGSTLRKSGVVKIPGVN